MPGPLFGSRLFGGFGGGITSLGSIIYSGSSVIGGQATVNYIPPSGVTFENVTWTFKNAQGTNVANAGEANLDQTFDPHLGIINHYLISTTQNVETYTYFWNELSGGTATIHANASYRSNLTDTRFEDVLTHDVSVAVPVGNISATYGTTVVESVLVQTVVGRNKFGELKFGGTFSSWILGAGDVVDGVVIPGILWTATLDGSTTGGVGGDMGVMQVADVVACDWFKAADNVTVLCSQAWLTLNPINQLYTYKGPLLDNTTVGWMFYGIQSPISVVVGQMATLIDGDSPRNFLETGHLGSSRDDNFELTLMWRPTEGQWVPIGKLLWGWKGEAANTDPSGNGRLGTFRLVSKVDPHTQSAYAATTDYPTPWGDTTHDANGNFVQICSHQ